MLSASKKNTIKQGYFLDFDAKYYNKSQLAKRFYTSKFNMQYDYELPEGVDENDTHKGRQYTKTDCMDFALRFMEFLEWVIVEGNTERIDFSENMHLYRDRILPKIKLAGGLVPLICKGNDTVENGKYYITNGRYEYKIEFKGDPYRRTVEVYETDPLCQRKRKDLEPIRQQMNQMLDEGMTSSEIAKKKLLYIWSEENRLKHKEEDEKFKAEQKKLREERRAEQAKLKGEKKKDDKKKSDKK